MILTIWCNGPFRGLIAMGRIVELPSIKRPLARRHQGLRKLSPDFISKAIDETNAQVIRIGLTLLGTAAFCLLSLLSPDSALLGDSVKINVPGAGPVSFFGFMLLGPAVLIMLRVYLQIYVEHGNRLDRLARSVSVVRVPTLVPLQNFWIWAFSGLIFYLLLPVATTLFAWKAAVFPAWGSGLFGLAVAAIASHVMLPFSRYSWRSRGMLSVGAAIIAGTVMLRFEPHRPFDLYRANLSGANLSGTDLSGANLLRADLRGANLSGANLSGADLRHADLRNAQLHGADLDEPNQNAVDLHKAQLRGANLRDANLSAVDLSDLILTGADLGFANLRGAHLRYAELSGANLSGTDLSGANLRYVNLLHADLGSARLSGADLYMANLLYANLSLTDLSEAKNLTQTQLDRGVCGDAKTKLPEGLTLKLPEGRTLEGCETR
jgi:hypothetical protein